jgi:hypothetical protein
MSKERMNKELRTKDKRLKKLSIYTCLISHLLKCMRSHTCIKKQLTIVRNKITSNFTIFSICVNDIWVCYDNFSGWLFEVLEEDLNGHRIC